MKTFYGSKPLIILSIYEWLYKITLMTASIIHYLENPKKPATWKSETKRYDVPVKRYKLYTIFLLYRWWQWHFKTEQRQNSMLIGWRTRLIFERWQATKKNLLFTLLSKDASNTYGEKSFNAVTCDFYVISSNFTFSLCWLIVQSLSCSRNNKSQEIKLL